MFRDFYLTTTFPINAAMSILYRDLKGLKAELDSNAEQDDDDRAICTTPGGLFYHAEIIAALDRTWAYGLTGNKAVIAPRSMDSMFLSRSIASGEYPALNPRLVQFKAADEVIICKRVYPSDSNGRPILPSKSASEKFFSPQFGPVRLYFRLFIA